MPTNNNNNNKQSDDDNNSNNNNNKFLLNIFEKLHIFTFTSKLFGHAKHMHLTLN